jgi:foldase protein PrsA
MRSSNRLSLTLSGLLLASVAIAAGGCGGSDDVPSNGIAKVGDTVITKSSFDQALERTLKSQAQSGAAVPDPPSFEKCVAELRKQETKDSKQKDSALEKQCKQSYQSLRDQTVEGLIRTVWVEQSAEDSDVEVTDAEVKQSLETQKKQIYPNEKDYRKFLKTSGATEADILEQVRRQLLQQLVTEKGTEGKADVSATDVSDYYKAHKSLYGKPERRDVLVVLAKSKASAEQAKRELAGGESWTQVAKRYSTDPTTKSKGGKIAKMRRGTEERAVDEAIFGARKGTLTGPVESQFGWYVIEVTKIYPANQKTFKQVEAKIREKLTTEREEKALAAYTKSYDKQYKEQTNCADGFKVPICSGEPDPPAAPTFPGQ